MKIHRLTPHTVSPMLLIHIHFLVASKNHINSDISTLVSERNLNNVPTIKSLLLERSKCTDSKKVYPLYREL